MNIYYKISFCFILSLLFFASCKKEVGNRTLLSDKASLYIAKASNTTLSDVIKEQYLDSSYILLADYKNDSITRNLYKKVSLGYYDLYISDKALEASKMFYNLSAKAKDTFSMANALYISGDIFYYDYKNDSALYYYSRSEKYFRILKSDTPILGDVLLNKALTYYNFGEYTLSEGEAIKALEILQAENDKLRVYSCYNTIAAASDGLNNNEEAIKYYNLALGQVDKFSLEEFSQDDINFYKATCYNNMGLVYEKIGLYLKAISLYREALVYKKDLALNSKSLYAKLINNIGHAKFKAADYSELPELYFKAYNIRDSLDSKPGIITSKINLGEYFCHMRDTAKAIAYYKDAYELAKKQKSHFDLLKALKILPELDISRRDYYYKRYIDVNDSLVQVDKLKREKFARIEYETDRLEDEKEALVKRNSYITGISAAALLFIGAVFIIYYLNSRNRKLMLVQEQQKANEEIYQLMFQQQSKVDDARSEEKNRIAMELHDGILNNIYAVRLNLEFINKKADEESIIRRKQYIKELQNVEMEIREVSHDLSRNAIFQENQSFTTLLEFMVKSQKNAFETNFSVEIDPKINWSDMSNIFKVNIYRIIQEAIQNINKYSEAENSKITVSQQDKFISVTITDDGVGFDTEGTKGGIGLKNLKKRASLLGGNFTIHSVPALGTTVTVVFPY